MKLTFGTVGAVVTVDAVALAEIARTATGAIVRTGRGDVLCLLDGEDDVVGPGVVVVDGQKPPARLHVLENGDVDHGVGGRAPLDDVFGGVISAVDGGLKAVAGEELHIRVWVEGDGPLQPVVHPGAFDELGEVVLRDARRHVASAVEGEVGPQGDAEVEADEDGALIAELRVPELERGHR